jgi:hypothetical protein
MGGPVLSIGEGDLGEGKVASIEVFDLDDLTASGLFQVRLNDRVDGPRVLYQFMTNWDEPDSHGASTASTTKWPRAPLPDYLRPLSPPTKASGYRDKGIKRKSKAKSKQPSNSDLLKQREQLWNMAQNAEDQATKDSLKKQYDDLMNQIYQTGAKTYTEQNGSSSPNPPGNGGPPAPGGPQGPFYSLNSPSLYLSEIDASSGREAAYWVGAGGQFTLLLEDGMSTSVGTIRQVYDFELHWGSNGDWNNYYQIALIADIATGPGGLQDAILLLTPTAAP